MLLSHFFECESFAYHSYSVVLELTIGSTQFHMAVLRVHEIKQNLLGQLVAHEQKLIKELQRAEQQVADWRNELELLRCEIDRLRHGLEVRIDAPRQDAISIEPPPDPEVWEILTDIQATASEKIRKIAIHILRKHGKPMKRKNLYEKILQYDIGLESNKPTEVVRKAIERSEEFIRVGRGLYSLKSAVDNAH